MKQMVIRRSGRVAVPSAAGCLFLVLSCDISVPDEARLQSLSEPELIELCDGLGDDLRGSAQVRECGDARSVALNSPHESWCTGEDLSSCRATAGDLRACHAAAWAAPCGAGERLPEECAPLFEAGCAPWATASPVYPFCELPLEEVAPFEGIYELTRHTRNEGSCVSEGGSVLELDGERLLVVKGQVNVDGAARATIRSCRDEPDCRAVAADPADAALPELQRDLDCRATRSVSRGAGCAMATRTRSARSFMSTA